MLFQIYVVCSILLFSLPLLLESDFSRTARVVQLPFLLPIIHVALVGSIYSTVALVVERYITICHPFVRYRYLRNIGGMHFKISEMEFRIK